MKRKERMTDNEEAALGHPKGTLFILSVYALLFVIGWAMFYLILFLGRGAPT